MGVMVYCPECPVQKLTNKRTKKTRTVRPVLDVYARNYSGCGVDLATCPECGKGFAISYGVDKITREPGSDGPSRQGRERQAEKQRLKEDEENIAAMRRIAKQYPDAFLDLAKQLEK